MAADPPLLPASAEEASPGSDKNKAALGVNRDGGAAKAYCEKKPVLVQKVR